MTGLAPLLSDLSMSILPSVSPLATKVFTSEVQPSIWGVPPNPRQNHKEWSIFQHLESARWMKKRGEK
jgi:hypothetical protein